ncbi:hypothetical protein GWK47_044949 [Chionoecetes opilio]|uniref:Uncharacterized protein n=1 Tax=Chionoecetes opilio TaxID=41210 RepID=A0A8J5CY43_CHIOP|nr:hypothetical protein GWK47_044949 [Chionoecetes opilio]
MRQEVYYLLQHYWLFRQASPRGVTMSSRPPKEDGHLRPLPDYTAEALGAAPLTLGPGSVAHAAGSTLPSSWPRPPQPSHGDILGHRGGNKANPTQNGQQSPPSEYPPYYSEGPRRFLVWRLLPEISVPLRGRYRPSHPLTSGL